MPRLFGTEVLFYEEEAADIAERVLGDDHLPKVVLPDIGFDGSSSKGFSGDGDDLPFGVSSGIAGCRNNKGHLGALTPEGARKFVREEQGIVPVLGR